MLYNQDKMELECNKFKVHKIRITNELSKNYAINYPSWKNKYDRICKFIENIVSLNQFVQKLFYIDMKSYVS